MPMKYTPAATFAAQFRAACRQPFASPRANRGDITSSANELYEDIVLQKVVWNLLEMITEASLLLNWSSFRDEDTVWWQAMRLRAHKFAMTVAQRTPHMESAGASEVTASAARQAAADMTQPQQSARGARPYSTTALATMKATSMVLTDPFAKLALSWTSEVSEEQNQNESAKRPLTLGTLDATVVEEVVQAGAESDHQLQLGLKERGVRVPLSWNKFPLWLNDRRLVAKFQRIYHGVHIFTIGVYVNKRCDVWGKKWDTSNYQELLALAVGNTTLRYEIVSKYLTRKMWAQDLVGKEIAEHYKGPKAEKALMARLHERLTYKGPIFHTGAVLDFVLQENQVWYLFNEQYIGKAGNHESSKAMLGAWVDDHSSEVFRNPLFSSLARGVDGHSLEMTARTGEEMAAWPMAIAVLVSATMALACAASCLCCYSRLKQVAEDDSFNADYVQSAA